MRKKERIKPFLEELGTLWEESFQEWRFGQLMYNFFYVKGDPFHWEEEKFIIEFKKFIKQEV